MKTYIGTETSRTIDLTAEEFGAYERLRRFYWEHEGLPADDRRLMRITGVETERWEAVRSVICTLFEPGWRLPTLDAEREAAAEQRVKAVERSRKANEKRWAGRGSDPSSTPTRNATSNPTRTEQGLQQGVLKASPSPSASDHTRYEEELELTHAHASTHAPAREEASPVEYADEPYDPAESTVASRDWLLKRGVPSHRIDLGMQLHVRGKLHLHHLIEWRREAQQ